MPKLREKSTQSSAVQNYQPPFLFVILLVFKTSLLKTAIMIAILNPSKNHKPCSKKNGRQFIIVEKASQKKPQGLHPGRLTWNLQITHLERKMIFQTSMIMFHINLQGCITGGWGDSDDALLCLGSTDYLQDSKWDTGTRASVRWIDGWSSWSHLRLEKMEKRKGEFVRHVIPL